MKRTQKTIVLAVCALVSVAAYVSAQPPAEPPPETAQALEVLGQARQEARQFSIRRNEDLSEKGDMLLEIAALYRDLGDTDRALRDVAAAQAGSGDLQGALALVSDGDYRLRKAYVWLGAAQGLAQRDKRKRPAPVLTPFPLRGALSHPSQPVATGDRTR